MAAPRSALDWEGQTVLDSADEKIGTIEEIFLVEETGRPEWGLVKVGRLKGHTTLVPLTRARPVEKGVKVHVSKDLVGEAPEVKADAEPSDRQVEELYRHYGMSPPGGAGSTSGNGAAAAGMQANPDPARGAGDGSDDVRDRPVGDLLDQAKEETSTLVDQEMKLAKAEMGGKAKEVGLGAGMFGGAGYVASLASLTLTLTIIFALAEAMAPWLAALIVTVLYGAIAGVLALMAKKRIQKAGPPIPEQTVESVKQTVQTVKEEAKWGLGQTR